MKSDLSLTECLTLLELAFPLVSLLIWLSKNRSFPLLEYELSRISVPVGRLELIHVRPFTFFEFLKALGRDILLRQIAEFNLQNIPVDLIHNKILAFLKDYLFIGGMPGVLKKFIEDNSYLSASHEQENILATYRADFNKYCGRAGTEHIVRVFETASKVVGRKVTYLTAIHGQVVPIEVKASAFGHLKSLHLFLSKYPSVPFGIKLSEQNFSRRDKIVSVPLYSVLQLRGILDSLERKV